MEYSEYLRTVVHILGSSGCFFNIKAQYFPFNKRVELLKCLACRWRCSRSHVHQPANVVVMQDCRNAHEGATAHIIRVLLVTSDLPSHITALLGFYSDHSSHLTTHLCSSVER